MTLVIETGTGSATSQAYASAAAYVTWATAYNGSAPTATTALQEAAILRAVAYMNGLRWYGVKSYGRVQALAWPRSGVSDIDGLPVTGTTIPPEVIEAQHMLTSVEIDSPGALSPVVTLGDQKTLTGLGDLTWTPAGSGNTVTMARASATAALDRLSGFIATGARVLRA